MPSIRFTRRSHSRGLAALAACLGAMGCDQPGPQRARESSPTAGDESGSFPRKAEPLVRVETEAKAGPGSEPPIEAKSQADVSEATASAPPRGSEITPEQAHLLLTDTVLFNPIGIPSSGKLVDATTRLEVGQDLQIKWGNSWWAGSILGFEEDGRVRVHYFGWASSYDELKTRAELQLDSSARVRALDSTFKRKGW